MIAILVFSHFFSYPYHLQLQGMTPYELAEIAFRRHKDSIFSRGFQETFDYIKVFFIHLHIQYLLSYIIVTRLIHFRTNARITLWNTVMLRLQVKFEFYENISKILKRGYSTLVTNNTNTLSPNPSQTSCVQICPIFSNTHANVTPTIDLHINSYSFIILKLQYLKSHVPLKISYSLNEMVRTCLNLSNDWKIVFRQISQ